MHDGPGIMFAIFVRLGAGGQTNSAPLRHIAMATEHR